MSIFPAYNLTKTDDKATAASTSSNATTEWLENTSFPLQNEQIKSVTEVQELGLSSKSSSSSTESDVGATKNNRDLQEKRKKKKKHKKKAKRRKRSAEEKEQLLAVAAVPRIEFDGTEEYYIDKAPAQQFRTLHTLHKPACPRYRTQHRWQLGGRWWWFALNAAGGRKPIKRYYRREKQNASGLATEASAASQQILDESEYTERLGQLNRKTLETPGDLQVWLDLIALNDQNPYKWSRLLLAERKLDQVQRALVSHPRNEQLYRLYIDIASVTYPSFEVTKMFDRLLAKDPYSYTLWTAQIMTTQGSMARCIVPDVLRIYERCMQKMHHAQQQSASTTAAAAGTDAASDDVMLRLFNNCALFLRQAGLGEQFFALIKLALELNVSTDQFGEFAPLESDQRTLIEYEELILQSGLPMNEIWLRIEKLRQGFNFQPCPLHMKCSDPQRMVFNEDVCHYIYPLKSRDNAFYLLLLALRLLKVPFIQCDGLAEKFSARVEHMGDSDAIEDLLAVCLRRSFALPPQRQDEFLGGLYTLAKEMAVSPTFLSSSIGYEIYVRCITEVLMNCAAAHAGIDERKRILFLLLWCRYERVLLLLERCAQKLDVDYVKAGRNRFKALLKQPPNRNVLNLYTELAIYEYEALSYSDSITSVQKIFENLIAAHAVDETQSSDLCHTYVTYAEILMGRGQREEALQVLASYALSVDIKHKGSISTAKKLSALQQLIEKLDRQVAVEQNVEIMVLEQYLLPDYTVSLLKSRTLLQCLCGQKLEAMAHLDKLLKVFRPSNDRHRFLREHIQELYVTVLQLPCNNCVVSPLLHKEKAFAALAEFPRNLFLLQQCGMLNSVPWYCIRAAMLRTQPTILSVTFLIVLARYRFMQMHAEPLAGASTAEVVEWDRHCNEQVVRNRILHMFKTLTGGFSTDAQQSKEDRHRGTYNALQRNALFWRLYLRCLSDQSTAFETSKKCLLTALDECPWSKALYLDGATYVPQELTNLQDLIIEKQLRIYALPEELEILREQ